MSKLALIKTAALLSLLLLLASAVFAESFDIENYTVNITVKNDAVIEVEEIIDTLFHKPRHGIFRNIPYKYDIINVDGEKAERDLPTFFGKYYTRLYDVRVLDKEYVTYTEGNDLVIKIGSAKSYVDGRVQYHILYKVYGAINFFKNNSELYWNIIGNGWDTQIKKVNFNITMPSSYTPTMQDVLLVGGQYGDKRAVGDYNISTGLISGNTNVILQNREGVTIAVKFPKELISKGSIYYRYQLYRLNTWKIYLPLAVFIICLLLWRVYGRDNRLPMMVHYNPPQGVTPAEAGFLVEDSSNNNHLISLIYYWASKGIIEIEEVEDKGIIFSSKDYIFTKLKPLDSDAKSFEHTIFDGIFSATVKHKRLSKLEDKFYTTLKEGLDQLNKYVDNAKYYEDGTLIASKFLKIFAGAAFFFSFFFGIMLGLGWGISLFVTLYIIYYFGKIIPKKSAKGLMEYQKLVGFKHFIEKVEKPRLEYILKEEPNYFDKILPYAAAFGIVQEWCDKFDGLLTEPPSWYKGSDISHFNMSHFGNSLHGSMSEINSIFTSQPSSSGSGGSGFSGGGSSGGGGGGGGGGSW